MPNRLLSSDEDSSLSLSNERIKITIKKNQVTQDNWTCTLTATGNEEVNATARRVEPRCGIETTRSLRLASTDDDDDDDESSYVSLSARRSVPSSRRSPSTPLSDDRSIESIQFNKSSDEQRRTELRKLVTSPLQCDKRGRSDDIYSTDEETVKTFGGEPLLTVSKRCLNEVAFLREFHKFSTAPSSLHANFLGSESLLQNLSKLSAENLYSRAAASGCVSLTTAKSSDFPVGLSELLQECPWKDSSNLFPPKTAEPGLPRSSFPTLDAKNEKDWCNCDVERTVKCDCFVNVVNSCDLPGMETSKKVCTSSVTGAGQSDPVLHGRKCSSDRCTSGKKRTERTLLGYRESSCVMNDGVTVQLGKKVDVPVDQNSVLCYKSPRSRCTDAERGCDSNLLPGSSHVSAANKEYYLRKLDSDGEDLQQEKRCSSVGSNSDDGVDQTNRRSLRPRKSKSTSPLRQTGKKKQKISREGNAVGIQSSTFSQGGFAAVPPPSPVPRLHEHELNMKTPVITVSDATVAYSDRLADTCVRQDVCLLKGLCSAINMDLKLFSSKTLKEEHGTHPMDIRIQRRPTCRASGDSSERQEWEWYSFPSQANISKYASYQAASYVSHQNKLNDKKSVSKASKSSKTAKNGSLQSVRKQLIYFGTNADLSDQLKWEAQIKELDKLPEFLRVNCPKRNMLNHIGHDVFGVNTVQLYMKVPGSRTPGHQENNNFCSVNINIGPGSCEWFCVQAEYWGVVLRMCQERKIDYLNGSWWPDLMDLKERQVPVYRCKQDPGDVIWIGPGTVHWVQSMGWCNNVAWNVGPLTHDQYIQAMERYEYNKGVQYKSIIPMTQVSWNLAANVQIVDQKLNESLRHVLSKSLHHCSQVKELIHSLNKEIKFQERLPDELTRYCCICSEEVYNIVFAARNRVYCFNCAQKRDSKLRSFHVLEEYDWNALVDIYNNLCKTEDSQLFRPS